MIRRPPRSTQSRSSAASDVYKRQSTRRGGQGLRGPSGAVCPRHGRQVAGYRVDRVHPELRPGASLRPRLLRPPLQARRIPAHPRRAHGALARRPGGGVDMGEHVRVGDLDIWTEQVGEGPDVLLIGGGGDTVESWQFQLDGLADRYRLTAFDNRGAGRTAMPGGSVSAEMMEDDAA